MATIYDVLDNFFSIQGQDNKDVATLSGTKILELADEVQRFSGSVIPPAIQGGSSPVYVGGWPSANIWNINNGGAAYAALLYSGQVLAKDPICDWFSKEQYATQRKLASRPGYASTTNPVGWNLAGTRTFLRNTIPGLMRIRPLVESGLIVLVPSNNSRALNAELIDRLGDELTELICADPKLFAEKFLPRELPIDDNLRGVFTFAGGDRGNQIKKSVASSAKYLLSEYFLARENGFDFVAPFNFEQFFCSEGISKKLEANYQSPVIEGLLSSSYPLFSGLTPETIISVRDDSTFGSFRKELVNLYGQLPNHKSPSDIQRFLSEIENAHLNPIAEHLKKEADRGFLHKASVAILPSAFRIGGAVIAAKLGTDPLNVLNLLSGLGAGETINRFTDRIFPKKTAPGTNSVSVWKKLYVNNSVADAEIKQNFASRHEQNVAGKDYWGIPDAPGTTVTLTLGGLIVDFIEKPTSLDKTVYDGSKANPYGFCTCRSGKKYKFCCKGLRPVRI